MNIESPPSETPGAVLVDLDLLDAAHRFARYWTVIRPFVGHVQREVR